MNHGLTLLGSRIYLVIISNRRYKVCCSCTRDRWKFASGKVRDWRASYSIEGNCSQGLLGCSQKPVKLFNVFWNNFRTLHQGRWEIAKQISYSNDDKEHRKLKQNSCWIHVQRCKNVFKGQNVFCKQSRWSETEITLFSSIILATRVFIVCNWSVKIV